MSSTLYLQRYKLCFMANLLSDRIKEIMKEFNVKGPAVAKAAGVSPMAVNLWKHGKTLEIKPSNATPLAKKFGLNPQWVMTGEGEKYANDKIAEASARYSTMHIQAYDDGEEFDPERYAALKVVDAELSAGDGFKNGDLLFEDKPLPFLRSTLKASGVREDKALVVRIIGNSMEPVMASGDTVGVDTGDKSPIKDGLPYAIRDVEMVRVKLLYRRSGGGLRIRSFNSAEYPDEDLTGEEVEERITVIGRVFWSSRMW